MLNSNSLSRPTCFSLLHPPMHIKRGLVVPRIGCPDARVGNSVIEFHLCAISPCKALAYYAEMRGKGVLGDSYTCSFVLKACGMIKGLRVGRMVHGEVVKRGYAGDSFVVNGLVGMYGKCGEMGCGRKVFDEFAGKNLVGWNMVLSGYVGCEMMEEAGKVFDKMPEKDVVSWSIMINAYGKKIGDIVKARRLFDDMPIKDLVSWNSIISGYIKVGDLVTARQLFHMMPERNVVSWTIMLEGYASHGDPLEALKIFKQMLSESLRIDKLSVVGALSACAQLGALIQGRWIHMYIIRNRIGMDIVVETALLDLYMKCGSLDEACRIFGGMHKRNVVSYTVMILGFGMNGYGRKALEYFYRMLAENIQPDNMLLLGVLSACSHAGLVMEGIHIFRQMKNGGFHGIETKLEHYCCLVDLLGRAGLLDDALSVIESMPLKSSPALWGSLLLASQKHQNVSIAEIAAKNLIELKADDCGTYVLLAKVYADSGLRAESLRIWNMIKNKKMKKEIGSSSIEVDGNIKEFASGEGDDALSEELRWFISLFLVTTDL